ncbi:MAG: DJ-1/PfpI family protein [Spirochaetaceae bacterium]|jgi:4-methyl-5(b-hydroxyethyl)-thiazole monophosphate biosynthesis|nr:DJ-1/PfpI family protein [Spirochaetaceae bacterium]
MSKKVLVFLAEGFEEVEAVTPIDYLRRAGIEVCATAIAGNASVKGSHGIPVTADSSVSALSQQGRLNAASWDGVLLPGGIPGAPNLAASTEVNALLKEMSDAGKAVCAICASPAVVLAPLGILNGRRFTCFPGLEEKVSGAIWSEDRVVIDRHIITSRGAGTAAEWSIAIISNLLDEATAQKIAKQVLLKA